MNGAAIVVSRRKEVRPGVWKYLDPVEAQFAVEIQAWSNYEIGLEAIDAALENAKFRESGNWENALPSMLVVRAQAFEAFKRGEFDVAMWATRSLKFEVMYWHSFYFNLPRFRGRARSNKNLRKPGGLTRQQLAPLMKKFKTITAVADATGYSREYVSRVWNRVKPN